MTTSYEYKPFTIYHLAWIGLVGLSLLIQDFLKHTVAQVYEPQAPNLFCIHTAKPSLAPHLQSLCAFPISPYTVATSVIRSGMDVFSYLTGC